MVRFCSPACREDFVPGIVMAIMYGRCLPVSTLQEKRKIPCPPPKTAPENFTRCNSILRCGIRTAGRNSCGTLFLNFAFRAYCGEAWRFDWCVCYRFG